MNNWAEAFATNRFGPEWEGSCQAGDTTVQMENVVVAGRKEGSFTAVFAVVFGLKGKPTCNIGANLWGWGYVGSS